VAAANIAYGIIKRKRIAYVAASGGAMANGGVAAAMACLPAPSWRQRRRNTSGGGNRSLKLPLRACHRAEKYQRRKVISVAKATKISIVENESENGGM